MELDLDRRTMLEEVLEAIGSGKRLATLERITHGIPGKDIHKDIDASRSGVQHFINDFKEADLIRTEDGAYVLTAKGEVVVEMLADLDAEFERFEREQFRNFAHGSTLSVEEMKEMLDDVETDQE
jgi:predicted transcriptional regulator